MRVSESADWLEWSDWSEPILDEAFEIQNGFATVTDKPGNGLVWNKTAVQKYSI